MISAKWTNKFLVIAVAVFSVVIKAESFFEDDIEKNNMIYDSNGLREAVTPSTTLLPYTPSTGITLPKYECTNEIYLCAETGGICKITNKNRKIECECSGNEKFVERKGCLRPDEMECLDFPCYNGGICSLILQEKEVSCYCPEGYSGYHCEIFPRYKCKEIYEKCVETDGQCISTGTDDIKDDIKCECPEGTSYVPPLGCKDLCPHFVCYNGGECQNENGEAKCNCRIGFTGKKCEKFPKEKCEEEIENCVETNGICISKDEDTVKCKCEKGYVFVEDEGCQRISTRDDSESIKLYGTFRTYIVIVGIMIGLLLFLQLIKTIFFYRLMKITNRIGRRIVTKRTLENASMESTRNQESENVYSEVNLETIHMNKQVTDREISCSTEKPGSRTLHGVNLSCENSTGQAIQGRNISSKRFQNQSNIHQPSGSKDLTTMHTMQYDNNAYDI